MSERELAKLKKWTDTLTDEQLKDKYYDAVFDTLGIKPKKCMSAVTTKLIYAKERSVNYPAPKGE